MSMVCKIKNFDAKSKKNNVIRTTTLCKITVTKYANMSTNLHLRDCKRMISQCSLIPFSMLAILIVRVPTGVIEPAVPMESALLFGKALTALSLSTTKRTWPAFILAAGTLAPTLI